MKTNEKITVLSRSFSRHPDLRNELLSKYNNVKFNDAGISFAGSELVDFLKDSDKAIVALEKIDDAILSQLPNLKLISKYGVGLDNIDLPALKKHNVQLSWMGGVNKRAVAELALSFALVALRKTFYANQVIKNNNWHQVQGSNLTGKTVGILGLGHVGLELVELLRPFEVKIIANDILDKTFIAKNCNVEMVTKDKIFSDADIISLHLPLTKKTENLIQLETLKKMRPSAILVNTARGGLVNEADLLVALKENIIAGAAFDVFLEEPNINLELLHHPHFIATPHIGGSSLEAVKLMGLAAIKGLSEGKEAISQNFFNYPIE